MIRHLLIAYGTAYGQTAKIAERLRDALVVDGFDVTLCNLATSPEVPDPSHFDGIIIGSSIIVGRHRRSVERFVVRHRDTLNRLPSAFYSVSGSAASADEKQRATARAILERFVTRVAWHPDLETTFGGGFPFTRYSWLTRWIMRRIVAHEGITDTTRDYDLTDWGRVEEFAHQFGTVVAPPAPVIT